MKFVVAAVLLALVVSNSSDPLQEHGARKRTRMFATYENSTRRLTAADDYVLGYEGLIYGGFTPGRLLKVVGHVPHNATGFAINLECGQGADVPLNIDYLFSSNEVIFYTKRKGTYTKQRTEISSLRPDQFFEMLILCERDQFKIAVNGVHRWNFGHVIPYECISRLYIYGHVKIYHVLFDRCEANCPYP